MKILLTGATSFSGYWFARDLTECGHDVVCLVTRHGESDYSDEYLTRYQRLKQYCRILHHAPFGSENFITAIKQEKPDLLGLHGAYIPLYRNADFDIAGSLAITMHNIHGVFAVLGDIGTSIMVTSSVFAPHAAADGDNIDSPGSPYGLAKGFFVEAVRYYASLHELKVGEFVIPNPFGPLENKKLCFHLVNSWMSGIKPEIQTPGYVRDNIPVTALANAYSFAVSHMIQERNFYQIYRPSGFRESNLDFASRLAREFGRTLNIECPLQIRDNPAYAEPLTRVNNWDVLRLSREFSLEAFWNDYVSYYAQMLMRS